MLWSNHRLIGASFAFALTGHVLPATFSYCGSIYPDKVEGFEFQDPNWWRNHRMSSHYWPFYLIPFLIGIIFGTDGHLTLAINPTQILTDLQTLPAEDVLLPFILYAVMWIAFGGLTHIFADFFCGSVPGLTPTHRIGYRLFIVGSLKEHAVCLLFCASAVGLRYLLTMGQGTFYLGI